MAVPVDRLYILSFDHRASFRRDLFGISGEPTPTQMERVRAAKRLIFDGFLWARDHGIDDTATGVLVDTQTGDEVATEGRRRGIRLAIPVERGGGRAIFDFDHGEAFGAHVERYAPDLSKVLVKYNPEGDRDGNALQRARLRRLSRWLRERDRKLLFELLVPPEPPHLGAVGGDRDRYDRELRGGLMVAAIAELQAADVEPDVWKVEGLEDRDDCELVAAQCRRGGRDHVVCVVLGRGADTAKVDAWLRQAAGVEGFVGLAIGRSIWSQPLRELIAGAVGRATAVERIGRRYLDFVNVFEGARGRHGRPSEPLAHG